MATPIQIKRISPELLQISWSDGQIQELKSELLRAQCPCATCREARGDTSHASPLTPKRSSLAIINSSSDEEQKLERIWAVGNYALGMAWGDGHSSGIYTYEYLKGLGN